MTERVSFVNSAQPGVTVLRVANSRRLWTYVHERLCVTIVRSGHGRWRSRGRDHDIEARKLMLMQPGDVHVTTAVEGCASFDALFVDPALIQDWFGDSLRGPRLCELPSSVETAPVTRAFQAILSGPDWRLDAGRVAEPLMGALRLLLESERSGTLRELPECERRLRRARDTIVERYRSEPFETVSMSQIARGLDVDYFWLLRHFAAHFHVTPYQFAMRVRMARARELVLAGPQNDLPSLTAVAQRAGYCDYQHMARDFRKDLGMKPTDLATQIGGWPTRGTSKRDAR
jgi:AraC-like DNA-binding protein